MAFINPTKYIQHNPVGGDGLEGFVALMAQLPKGSAKVTTRRVFQDGDYVFTHTECDFFGPKIGFDIFRLEDGKTRPGQRRYTMIDGRTDARDTGDTQSNKTLVRSSVDDILVNGHMQLRGYCDGDAAFNSHSSGEANEVLARPGVSMKEALGTECCARDFVLINGE